MAARPARRRRADGHGRVARDLLDQRADRHRRDRPDRPCSSPSPAPRSRVGSTRSGRLLVIVLLAHPRRRTHRGAAPRLDLARRSALRGGRRRPWSLSSPSSAVAREPLIDVRFFRSIPFSSAVVTAVAAFGANGGVPVPQRALPARGPGHVPVRGRPLDPAAASPPWSCRRCPDGSSGRSARGPLVLAGIGIGGAGAVLTHDRRQHRRCGCSSSPSCCSASGSAW